MSRAKLEILARQMAEFNKVDSDLVLSIIEVESSFNHWAVRYEGHWKHHFKVEEFARRAQITAETEKQLQMMSFGLMQVMGTVARELGHLGNLLELCQPEVGLKFGIFKLLDLMKKHRSELDVISAYNAGTPKKGSHGLYVNQGYVTKVSNILNFRRRRAP